MIDYRQDGTSFWVLFRYRGSVFPYAACVATPSALISIVFKYLDNTGRLGDWSGMEMTGNSSVFSGLVILLGFLVVFRTSQAYGRFWSALNDTTQMCADWSESFSMVMAFTAKSLTEAPTKTKEFQHTMARLFSILNAN